MLASLSLDLDNKWSYLKTHGDEAWSKLPSYLDLVVPRILNTLDEFDLKITFFIVGLDADQEANSSALRQISQAGHEIGNHSYRHEPWLHLYSREEIVAEFAKTEVALERVTGRKPIGFRGPGFSLLVANAPVGPSAQALPAGVAAFRYIQRYFFITSYFFY